MGVPTAEVGYTSATARRRDHESSYEHVVALGKKLLARAWYMAQILPPPKDNLRQINMTISWFLWKGEIFRVPLSTLQKTKKEGGWGMIHPAGKCMALFFHRMREQGKKNVTVTADWMQRWGLQEQTENPPYAGRTPTTLAYLHQYDMESAYLARRDHTCIQKAPLHDDTYHH
jgi:hypothetical protein